MTYKISSKIFITLAFLTYILSAYFSLTYAAGAQNYIVKTKINYPANNAKITFETKKFPKYRVYTMSKPERLVVDLQDVSNTKNIKFPDNKIFNSAKVSKNNIGDIRVIFYLRKKLTGKPKSNVKIYKNGNYQLAISLFGNYQPIIQKAKKTYKPKPHISPLNSKIADLILEEKPTISAKKTKTPILTKPSHKKKPVIVIDAGHGGKDPGAIGRYLRTKEKNITLAYATELKKHLDATKKFTTYLTRNSDYFITLSGRVRKARAMKADLFISIHADSAENRKANGLSIYTLSEKSSDKQAARLAAKENKSDIIGGIDFTDASSEVLDTLISMAQRDTKNSSAKFAQISINTLKSYGINVLQNTHRFAGFRVLTAADVPSVLIELGYLSNRTEERQLNTRTRRKKTAAALTKSIQKYFQKY